jgi:CRISPR-associated protein Csm3
MEVLRKMTNEFRLHDVKIIRGTITVITGLHIGAGRESVEIGGMDNPVIKNPVNGEPYIPGSSLKGKMRSLLEWQLNKVESNSVCRCGQADCPVCRIFGSSTDSTDRGPTRLIVRDCPLSENSRQQFKENNRPLLETKYENTINRLEGKAGNPRPLERVTPGTQFDLEILFKVLHPDDEDYFQHVLDALELIQRDFLGGCGSRGCGQIQIDYQETKEAAA